MATSPRPARPPARRGPAIAASLIALAAAGGLAFLGARASADFIERNTARDLTAALLREQQGGRAAIKALPESDARIASAGEQLAQLVGKGEPTLARITVAAGLLGDLARLRTTGVLV